MRSFLIFKAALLSLAVFSRAEDNCDAGPGEAPFAPGRVGGWAFPDPPDDQIVCQSRWKGGEVIVGMKAWSTRTEITGVQFKFSSTGWGNIIGHSQSSSWYSVPAEGGEWPADQPVRVEIWNKNGGVHEGRNMFTGPGRIIIWKGDTQERIFEVQVGGSEVNHEMIRDIPQGAGIILGVKTRSRDWVSTIEFKMQKSKIVKTELKSINLVQNIDDWNKVEGGKRKGIESMALVNTYYKNKNEVGGASQSYSFKYSETKEESQSITFQRSHAVNPSGNVKVGAEIKVPKLHFGKIATEGQLGISYIYTKMDGGSTDWKKTKVFESTQGSGFSLGLLAPQRAAHCVLQAVSGTFDSEFSGKIEATFEDQSKYLYSTHGDVHSVGWAQIDSSCKDMPLKDVPANAPEGAVIGDVIKGGLKRAVVFRG